MMLTTPDSVELANELRPVLLQLNRHLRREAHAEGITGGQAALLAQIRNDPELGIGGLAAREGVSAPAMTRYVDRLERRCDEANAQLSPPASFVVRCACSPRPKKRRASSRARSWSRARPMSAGRPYFSRQRAS